MAYLEPRRRKDGTDSYRVAWRLGGKRDGAPQSETFGPRQLRLARKFKADVEACDHQWPPNYLPRTGYVDPSVIAEHRKAAEAAEQAPLLFRDYARTWTQSLSGVQSKTRGKYWRIIAAHILPSFGEADMRDPEAISRATVGAWVNALESGERSPLGDAWIREPLRPKTIRNIHGILFAIMAEAVDAEPPLRAANPCRKTRLPKLDDGEGDEEMIFLSPEEFATIHALIKPDAADLAEFLVGTGLRYSEATALQVRDFELGTRPHFRVWRAWKQEDDGSWRLGPPKTAKSRRRLRLTARQVDLVLPLLAGKAAKDFVFTNSGGSRWLHSTFLTCRWYPALYAALRCRYHRDQDVETGVLPRRGTRGLRKAHLVPCGCPGLLEKVPRVHDLRHTHVAWLIAAGTRESAIQKRLGHESITTTIDRYGHMLPEVDDNLIEGLETMMDRLETGRSDVQV